MKKKLLFLGMSLNMGGAEKALVNLLNMIDYETYEVDLLLFQKRGVLLKQIPTQVKLLSENTIEILYQSIRDTIFMSDIKVKNIFFSIFRYIVTGFEKVRWKQFDQIRIHRWLDFYSRVINANCEPYDVAIAFAGGETAYYMVDKVKAKRKVYFFHSNYANIDIDATIEMKYVDQVDLIVTISDICKKSLIDLFPTISDRIVVLQNLSSSKLILKQAMEYKPVEFNGKNEIYKIVSVGRLNPIKGYDMAIEAATILKNKGMKFCWVIVGEGEERKKLELMITSNGLTGYVILCGLKENPYPYMFYADVVVQTSRFEGKSIVLDEAKILNKQIVVTNYDSVEDQISSEDDGIIVEMNGAAIAKGIESIFKKNEKENSDIKAMKNDMAINEYMRILLGD